uniref:Integrase, catalytic region, zinc finger, CCHC-type, peptidase aspartic, catalytic n=1 Tax=Tanacetum cinerariifolium TaxID=118510 RepID=A0A699GXT4_TANCI|nr:integrase, catalytic region, zinc finger, CCHC-type, peptidase aspartic, catalytic [Tanacetum cinerariifolium]
MKQERECKLYDEFDKFAYKKGETLSEFYLRFSLLLNDMNIYNMKLENFQVNTKYLNTLPPEWNKFVTDVKLVRDLHTTNVDQLHAYLGQHEFHANESSQYGSLYQSQQYSYNQSLTPLSITYPSNEFQSSVHHNVYSSSSSIPQVEYAPPVHQQPKLSQPDTGLIVLVFQKEAQATQTVITHNAAYQANGLDAYDSDCDEINSAKVSLMPILSRYGSDDFAEVQNYDNVNHNLINQAVQAMSFFEQSNIVNQSETEITNDSNIISYSHKINLDNKSVNDTLTAELERYMDQDRILKEGQNVDLKSKDNGPDSCAQSNSVNSPEPTPSSRPTKVDVPKKLPKVSMVNTSLKKLKHHLASFDVVIKERTITTAITEGTWGFKHKKAYFKDEIIPFVKELKDLFNSIDQFLVDELSEV